MGIRAPAYLARTLERVAASRPDRVAIYGYGHIPALFKAQRRICEVQLPDAATRLRLRQFAVERLVIAGYVRIGIDHFALPAVELALALHDHRR